jgi:hypothetical protein
MDRYLGRQITPDRPGLFGSEYFITSHPDKGDLEAQTAAY